MRGGLPRTFGEFDAALMGEAFKRPGIDPRTWVSYGTVESNQQVDGETINSVEYDDEGMGPLVNVRLQPGNTSVRCRVAMIIAGNGEAEYHPFVEGDEVIVLLPEGSSMTGPVIVGRLCNTVDKFPDTVSGQATSKNSFGFTRRRSPYVQEFASNFLVRVASHGGFILINDSGMITLRDGSKGALQMGPDVFCYMEGARSTDQNSTPTPTALLQLDLTGRRAVLQMDDAMLMLNSSKADNEAGNVHLITPAQLTAQCGTNQPNEHVATVEGVVNIIEKLVTVIGALLPVPLIPPADKPVTAAIVAAALTPMDTTQVAPALALALQAMAVTPKGAVDATTGVQTHPMLGTALFKTG